MVGLKLPIAALLWIVWWAIHAEPEETQDTRGDDGGTKVERHPRKPLPPARVRRVTAIGREHADR